jgi:hypothetical protein
MPLNIQYSNIVFEKYGMLLKAVEKTLKSLAL